MFNKLGTSLFSRWIPRTSHYSVHIPTKPTRVTIGSIRAKFEDSQKLTMITAYDYSFAKLANKTGIDMILVGDSLGMTMLGHKDTRKVTVDQMVHHCQAVVAGAGESKFIVGDLPFGSYEVSDSQAVESALHLLKEGGTDAVKLEGGERMAGRVRAIVSAGIPVMGHVGLTPQTASALGGFKVQGTTVPQIEQLKRDIDALQQAGCFSIVLELVPEKVATELTKLATVPLIGIGAGSGTSGQVLVLQDFLGMFPDSPRFSKVYADVGKQVEDAIESYRKEVETGKFPAPEHTFKIKDEVFRKAFPHEAAESSSAAAPIAVESVAAEASPAPAITDPSGPIVISPSPARRIAIIGGGAMASLFAGRLATAGHRVAMLTSWGAQVVTVAQSGLTMLNLDNSVEQVTGLFASSRVSEIRNFLGAKPDLVLVLVKSSGTKVAAGRVAELLDGEDSLVVSLQNGLGNRETLEDVLSIPVVQGITTAGSMMIGPGRIAPVAANGITYLACPATDPVALAELSALLSSAGLAAEVSSNRDSLLWSKLVVNAGINPTTALFQVKNGELDSDKFRPLVSRVVTEAADVAAAQGIPLLFPDPVEATLSTARNTAANSSSMRQDLSRGVETEIDAINGKVVEIGQHHGVAVATNLTLVELVHQLTHLRADGKTAAMHLF